MSKNMESNIVVRQTCIDDFDWVKRLWYDNRDTLSIPFTRCITDLCTCDGCSVVEVDGTPVAFGRIHFAKRCFELRIEHLVVSEEFRGRGIGTLLLKHLVSNFRFTSQPLIEPDIIANAVVGAKNNSFYDKYAKSRTVINRKTKSLYRYVLDKRRICE